MSIGDGVVGVTVTNVIIIGIIAIIFLAAYNYVRTTWAPVLPVA